MEELVIYPETGETVIKINPFRLLEKQQTMWEFDRIDMVVRFMFIADYFGQASGYYDLYAHMQKKRLGLKRHEIWTKMQNFRALIASFEEKGFLEDYPIVVDSDYRLIDGAHRLACALYFNIEKIPVVVKVRTDDRPYGLKWFSDNGFTLAEIEMLKRGSQYLLDFGNDLKKWK